MVLFLSFIFCLCESFPLLWIYYVLFYIIITFASKNNIVFLLSFAVFATDNVNQGPFFTNEPLSRVEFSNSSGTVISCMADGRPRPVISWLKSDGEIVHDLPGLRHTRHDGSLVFSPFSAEDYRADVHASIYRCEATNSVGTIGSRDVHVRAGKQIKLAFLTKMC